MDGKSLNSFKYITPGETLSLEEWEERRRMYVEDRGAHYVTDEDPIRFDAKTRRALDLPPGTCPSCGRNSFGVDKVCGREFILCSAGCSASMIFLAAMERLNMEPVPEVEVGGVKLSPARSLGAVLTEDLPDRCIWGAGEEILWADGEVLLIVGETGIGKTTIAQRIALARAGLIEPELLGFPITPHGRVLYVAADRPRQAIESLKRMVSPAKVGDRLRVHRGPLPFKLSDHPEILVGMAQANSCETVILDSLKDVSSLTDEAGARCAEAFQRAVARGVNVIALHHAKQSARKNGDAYAGLGSAHVPNTAGSIFFLSGRPGDRIVKMRQKKAPETMLDPLTLSIDFSTGMVTRSGVKPEVEKPEVDLVKLCGREGLSVREATEASGLDSTNKAETQRVYRKLEAHVRAGELRKEGGRYAAQ